MRPFVMAAILAILPGIGLGSLSLEAQKPKRVIQPVAAQAPQQPKAPLVRSKGYKPLTPAQRRTYHDENTRRHGHPIKRMAENTVNPPAFDCSSRGWICPTWDQGQCGDCYLDATVRQMTCAFIKNGYGKNDGSFALSVQFGLDCQNFGGCDGGNGTEVIAWAKKNGWIAETYIDSTGKTINDYPPYSASPRSCRAQPGAKKWIIADWGFIDTDGAFDIEYMKTAMTNFGGLNIAIDAGGQFGNGTSTITRLGDSIDHEIMATAYDDNHDNGDGTKGAVLLWNQWGQDWGTGGFRWCSYSACRHIVDWFWVSVTPLPPPTPPTPPVPPTPPATTYVLFEGAKQVGSLTGYPTLPAAETDAHGIATKDNVPVSILAAGSVVEVVQPGTPPPLPPSPTGSGTFTLTLTGPLTVTSADGTMSVVLPTQTISGVMNVTSGPGISPKK